MRIPVNTAGAGYEIVIENGILKKVSEEVNLDRNVLIVTDTGVPKEYAECVYAQCKKKAVIKVIEQGESSKNFNSFIEIQRVLVENGFNRHDCVIAIGGGVVGDLSGFVASTFMRGIDFVNIPTTVLSQVDSSIGGKTAVDFEGVKNIVGTFYQPKKVIIDPEALKTLPKRQISNGLAEAVKMSLTFDGKLFERFENGEYDDVFDIIPDAIKIKRMVVEKDEREAGLRMVLNFGHTLGHGIEVASGGKLLHGECVALGMLGMCEEAVQKRLIAVMKALGLPLSDEFDIKQAMEAVKHDKKGNVSKIKAIVVREAGSCEIVEMTPEELEKRLESIVSLVQKEK